MVQVIAFAGAFADARKHRIAAMAFGDIVDQFHDQHGLAHARAAEQADLAALGIGRQQVHHLDAGDQNFGFGRLIDKGRGRLMNAAFFGRFDRAAQIHRLADHIDDTAQHFGADRHHDLVAAVGDFLPAHQAVGCVHGDGAHRGFAQMLRHFQHQPVAVIRAFQRIQNCREMPAIKGDVNDGADDLRNTANNIAAHVLILVSAYSASAPEMISISSLVIDA